MLNKIAGNGSFGAFPPVTGLSLHFRFVAVGRRTLHFLAVSPPHCQSVEIVQQWPVTSQ